MNLKLRSYRESRGLTQQELAKQIGKSFRTIQSWERSESYPNAEAVCLMCDFFGTDPNDFLGWYDEHPEDRPSASVTREESTLLSNYRASSPEGREFVARAAMMACGQEQEGRGSSSEAEAV